MKMQCHLEAEVSEGCGSCSFEMKLGLKGISLASIIRWFFGGK